MPFPSFLKGIVNEVLKAPSGGFCFFSFACFSGVRCMVFSIKSLTSLFCSISVV